jgi:hypothetical protein
MNSWNVIKLRLLVAPDSQTLDWSKQMLTAKRVFTDLHGCGNLRDAQESWDSFTEDEDLKKAHRIDKMLNQSLSRF